MDSSAECFSRLDCKECWDLTILCPCFSNRTIKLYCLSNSAGIGWFPHLKSVAHHEVENTTVTSNCWATKVVYQARTETELPTFKTSTVSVLFSPPKSFLWIKRKGDVTHAQNFLKHGAGIKLFFTQMFEIRVVNERKSWTVTVNPVAIKPEFFSFVFCVCVQLKQMEVQLEEEYDEKQKVLKEKRELESKLLSAQDKVTSPWVKSTSCWTMNRILGWLCPIHLVKLCYWCFLVYERHGTCITDWMFKKELSWGETEAIFNSSQ